VDASGWIERRETWKTWQKSSAPGDLRVGFFIQTVAAYPLVILDGNL
jgi:hypothetical protein